MNKMQTTRRRVLAFLGATPITAKAMADRAIGDLAGVASNGIGGNAVMMPGQSMAAMNCAPQSYETRLLQAAEHIKLFGIPEWQERRWRESARWVSALDPDLACKRSWSMSVKIAAQRERNYRRLISQVEVSEINGEICGRRVLTGLLGFEWPW